MGDESTATPSGTEDDYAELKQAIAKERDATKAAEKRANKAEKTLEEVQSRLAKIEEDGKSETERELAKARKEAAEEARTDERSKWASQFVQAKAQAVAAQKLADPDDVRLLDLNEFQVGEDGTIQGDIAAAVDKLIEAKPHLAAKRGTRQGIDQGVQGGTPGDSVDDLFGRAMQDAAGMT